MVGGASPSDALLPESALPCLPHPPRRQTDSPQAAIRAGTPTTALPLAAGQACFRPRPHAFLQTPFLLLGLSALLCSALLSPNSLHLHARPRLVRTFESLNRDLIWQMTGIFSLAIEALRFWCVLEPRVLIGLVLDIAEHFRLIGPRARPNRVGLGGVGIFEQSLAGLHI